MAKETAAQRHTKAHAKRRTDRVTNRPMPSFEPGTIFVSQSTVIAADKFGDLVRIDPESGTIRKLRWEQ